MRFNVISNLTNGVGLQKDYELLKHALEVRGHTVHGVQFNAKPPQAIAADVNVFLEVVTPSVFRYAPRQWAVPNPEWWFNGWDRYQWDLVLAKTRDCERIFTEKVGDRCQYLGWLARDLYRPGIERHRKFLHVCGKSHFKNTMAVVMGCQQARVPLTVIGEHAPQKRRVSDQELILMMNSHFCHVMPSEYEGYGQVLHEALSAGQIVVTTDAPPMNEVKPSVLVPSASTRPHHAGVLHKVSALEVAKVVRQIAGWPPETIQQYAEEARAQYLGEVKEFHEGLDRVLGGV